MATATYEADVPDALAPAIPVAPRKQGSIVVSWVTSTDHKIIGKMYLITSFFFFIVGGLLALLIRAELFEPGTQVVQSAEQYNQLFTMHGTIMLLLFATPLFAGFANAIMPLQIGAPDVAFPRLNMLAYWLYLFGGVIALAKPANSGVANRNNIIVPCIVNSWLYCSFVGTTCMPGANSSARINIAMIPAIPKKMNAVTRYMFPTIL